MSTPLADALSDAGAIAPTGPPPTEAGAPELFRNIQATSVVGALQIGVLFVMLCRSKLLAVLLRPEGIGIVSMLDQLVQFVTQVSAFSLIAAPTRFIARAVVEGRDALVSMYQALLKILLLTLVGGAAITLMLLVLAPQVLGTRLTAYVGGAAVAIVGAPLAGLSMFYANVAAATKGYRVTSLYLFAAAAMSLAAAYVGVRTRGIVGLYYGNLVASAVCVTALIWYLHSVLPLRFHVRGFRLFSQLEQHRDILAYCGTSYVLTFAQPLAFLIVRSLALDHLGSTQAGYFHAAFAVSSLSSMVLVQAIRVYLEPQVNRTKDDRLKIAAANDFQRTFAILVLLGTLPLVLFPREIIALLFSPAFTPVSGFLFIFVIADCMFLCAQVYGTVVMAVDDFRGFFLAQIAGYILLAVLAALLTPRFGVAGLAWSFVVSRGAVFGLMLGVLALRHRLFMSARLGAVLLYALAAVLGSAMVFGDRPVTTAAVAAIRIAVFAAIALGTLRFLARDERAWLLTWWRPSPGAL